MKNTITIDLPLSYHGGWRVVKAELLPDLAPHITSWTWAVSQGLHDSRWRVTNIETGNNVGIYRTEKSEAIEAARERLSLKTNGMIVDLVLQLPLRCRE